jgi:PKD repeat protein
MAFCLSILSTGCKCPSKKPTAAFTATANGLTLTFTDASSANRAKKIKSWAWSFGDGATSADQNPTHAYTQSGTYEVTLEVTTKLGSNSTSQSFTVIKNTPTASFTETVDYMTVSFTDTSTPGTHPITSWVWSFGDGASSSEQNPSHVYTLPGTYNVSLEVTTSIGSNSTTQSVTAAGNPPTAAFTKAVDYMTVSFTDASTPGTYPITSWAWSFGDGGTSTEQNPSHVYAQAGTYAITLQVTSPAGGNSANQSLIVALWRVKSGGTGDGGSWDKAFGKIQDAVDAASASHGGEVWVAAGTYAATSDTDENVVVMKENANLYGGFAGTETSREQRNWTTNQTIIDGGSARRCVYGAGNATLDGFVIQNGYTTTYGAGMYNLGVSPTIANCAFSANKVEGKVDMYTFSPAFGGGMYNASSSSPTLTNCTFSKNSTIDGHGGAMCNASSSSPTLTDCVFTENSADDFSGGAMYNNSSSSPTLTDCAFTENSALQGGAIFNISGSSSALNHCTFTSNSAHRGGAVLNESTAAMTFENCVFTNNSGNYGGAILCYHASVLTLSRSYLTNNSAAEWGGALEATASSPYIVNCLFTENTANWGGAISNDYNSATQIVNCTFAKNSATYVWGIFNTYKCSTKIVNCILWDNASEVYDDDGSSTTISYSCINGGWAGTGNTSADPYFVDPSNGDFSITSQSPCFNKGTDVGAPATDILGLERPQFEEYDMGAYESTSIFVIPIEK